MFFFSVFSAFNVTKKKLEITWGEYSTFINAHSFPLHTCMPKSYERCLIGGFLERLKAVSIFYPMWFEQMSSLELGLQSFRGKAEGSASVGLCMTNFLSASDFIII